MLEETFHCDGPNCQNTTPKAHPSRSWRVSRWLSVDIGADRVVTGTEDLRENHYCSRNCEYEHSYLLVAPGSGK